MWSNSLAFVSLSFFAAAAIGAGTHFGNGVKVVR